MENKKKSQKSENILSNIQNSPVTVAVAAGLYPLLFYYSRNFTMIDSWAHLGYFVMIFLVLPSLFFFVFHWVLGKKNTSFGRYLLPFLNLFVFFFFLKMILFVGALNNIITSAVLVISVFGAYFLYKYFAKWIILQFILAIIGVISLVPILINNLNYSDDWMKQPDGILDVSFKHKPNIYYIQPDGYVNFSELERGYYNYKKNSCK